MRNPTKLRRLQLAAVFLKKAVAELSVTHEWKGEEPVDFRALRTYVGFRLGIVELGWLRWTK